MIALCPKCAGSAFVIRVNSNDELIAYSCLKCLYQFKDLKTREKV